MRPEYEIIAEPAERSFTTRLISRKSRPLLSQAWHFHPELEICYTMKSSGRRFVGNQISEYQETDLVMFGSNLPHGFTTEMNCRQVVIQMTADFMGEVFINKPELHSINNLFMLAKHGLVFQDQTKRKAQKIIKKLLNKQGMNQLLCLLELLHVLAESKDVQKICTEEYALGLNVAQLGRIKIVYDHIMENFHKEVSIKVIANKINISEPAFYKFIKKQTKKTYTQIINEFRINHASKLLMTSDKNITQICYESGYNNVSYFNRKFKEIMQQTPQLFKRNYIHQNQ